MPDFNWEIHRLFSIISIMEIYSLYPDSMNLLLLRRYFLLHIYQLGFLIFTKI